MVGKERFAECRTFVCKHKLFLQALQLYSLSSEEFKVEFGFYASANSSRRIMF